MEKVSVVQYLPAGLLGAKCHLGDRLG